MSARLLYGFRISVLFASILTVFSSIVGIAAGAIQGYFGGWVDLIFFLGVIFAIFFIPAYVIYILLGRLIDRWKRAPRNPPTHRSPLDILEERFAQGEINQEEFEARRRMLGDGRPPLSGPL